MRVLPARFLLLFACLLVLAACSPALGDPLPTPWPTDYLPTVVALTAQSLAAQTPLPPESPTPTEPLTATAPPTLTPTRSAALNADPADTPTPAPPLPSIEPTFLYFLTVTPTPTPEAGRAAIYFDRPGPMSKVISPIPVRAWVGPRNVGNTRLELIGEDGRLITRKSERTFSVYFQWARLALDLPFEIRGASELARLQVVTEARNGRLTGLNSVHVLLLSLGEAEISTFTTSKEPCFILSPQPDAVVSGGEVRVDGEMRPYNSLPVIFELWDDDGRVLGTRVYLFGPPDGAYQKFSLSVPYDVKEKTTAWLVVRQSDDRIEGLRYLYSQSITLEP